MIDNPLLAITIALAGALLATIAAYLYTDRQCRRRIAQLSRQRPVCAVQPPLPTQLRHQGDRLIIVTRVRRPRNN
jgi:hypothetical protein